MRHAFVVDHFFFTFFVLPCFRFPSLPSTTPVLIVSGQRRVLATDTYHDTIIFLFAVAAICRVQSRYCWRTHFLHKSALQNTVFLHRMLNPIHKKYCFCIMVKRPLSSKCATPSLLEGCLLVAHFVKCVRHGKAKGTFVQFDVTKK